MPFLKITIRNKVMKTLSLLFSDRSCREISNMFRKESSTSHADLLLKSRNENMSKPILSKMDTSKRIKAKSNRGFTLNYELLFILTVSFPIKTSPILS